MPGYFSSPSIRPLVSEILIDFFFFCFRPFKEKLFDVGHDSPGYACETANIMSFVKEYTNLFAEGI